MRIAYRWEAIDLENKEIELAKELGKPFVANKLENGDTHKQLLARSRYLFSKIRTNGRPHRYGEQNYCSNITLSCQKHMIWLRNWDIFTIL
jgi:hypothetical protein